MRILSQIPSKSEFTTGMPASGREYLSLVVKSTYDFPESNAQAPTYSADQIELIMADEYSAEPGYSACLRETDFAFRKHRCDVIAHGCAHAPNGKPVDRVRVGLRVGQMIKQFDVVGAREWSVIGPTLMPTRPYPFTRMEFCYDTAFGGPDRCDPDDPTPPVFDQNPVGMGFAATSDFAKLAGQPVPNTEEIDRPITSPFEPYNPMALGPLGRGWPLRRKYTGTYDQNWIDNVFPFLPQDFDERYYQMASEDQQIDLPQTGTEVVILGMTPNGRESFRLPETGLPIRIFRRRETVLENTVRPDTLYFDTEARQFTMTWRVEVPIKRDITEFTEAWVGPPTQAMLKAFREGRAYIRDVATEPAEETS